MLRKLLLSIVLCGFGTLPGFAQTELTEYLDKEVAAVAVVSKPAVVFEQVAVLIGFSDEEWASVKRLATDESFGIVHPEKADSIENGLVDLKELLSDVEEIGAVLHSRETGDFSIVIKAAPEIHEELFLRCGKVARDILGADQPPEEVQSKFDPIKLDCFFKSCDNWIVISNNKSCGAELVARIGGKSVPKRNVLKATRKYQRVSRAMVSQDLDAPSITCYGSPEKISQWFFPDLSDSVRKAYKFNEVPAIGLHIDFAPKSASQNVPNISFEFVVPFTEPRGGYGAIIDSYAPLGELPPIPFDIMQLDAYGVDSVKLHEATMKIMDEANSQNAANSVSKKSEAAQATRKLKRTRTNVGPESYLESQLRRARRYGFDFYKDELQRMNKHLLFRFNHPKIRRIDKLKLEGIKNYGAMARYIESSVDAINRMNREEAGRDIYQKIPNPYGIMKSHKRSGFFVGDDWSITGNVEDIEKMAGSLYEDPQPSKICKAISRTIAALDEDQESYRVNFFSLWFSYPGQFERVRIEEKHMGDRNKIREVLSRRLNDDGYLMDIEDKDDCRAVLSSVIGRNIARKFGSVLLLYFNEDRRLRVKGGVFPQFNYANQYFEKEDEK